VFLLSASGNVIDTVKTDPRLVPNQSVGMSAEGSKIRGEKHENNIIPVSCLKLRENYRLEVKMKNCTNKLLRKLTALLCITINER
jgi:hypothetical protein